jgi:three-Cys-motif partner protein
MSVSNHEFGGVSTDLKLSMVQAYLSAFTTALRNRFTELWYIDAFAGTGERTVRLDATPASLFDDETSERIEHRRGSAQIAIDTLPKFQRLFFIEKKQKHIDALCLLAEANQGHRIDIHKGDANQEIRRIISAHSWTSTRAVMFLDPYGMSVEWQTLEVISATKAIDVWYFVSLAGLFRQAALDGNAIDETKRQALNRMLGTNDWEEVLYKKHDPDLWGDIKISREANVADIEKYFQLRLQTIFSKVLKPRTFYNEQNVPMFSLFFAISNPEGKAIGLATKIASHILSSGNSSQVRPK